MIGATISHYRILGALGVGGMSVVYLAEDMRLGRQVALKLLAPRLEQDPASLERLRREARLTSALSHPNICTIHDVGEHEGHMFLVMERLEGRTLKKLIERESRLPVPAALRLASQVVEALVAAHAQGIVHRDIKPGNIFVTSRGNAKVMDFGLAKQLPRALTPDASTGASVLADARTLTMPGEAIGTIAYMSPEQARGEAVDARTDLFALGAVLFEMLSGTRAFPGTAPAVVFDALLNRSVASVSSLVPDVPLSVAGIVDRLLTKDRTLRYQSAVEVRDDLTLACGAMGEDLAATVSPGLEQGDEQLETQATTVATRTLQPPARPSARGPGRARARPWRLLAAGAALLALGALGWWALGGRTRAPALTERDSLLLGDVANETGDSVFDGTLREALAVQFGQSPFLDIVADDRVRETLRLMGREPDLHLPHDVAREACQRLNAKVMVEGRIGRLGEHYVTSLTATACTSGDTIALEQIESGRKEDVLRGLGRAVKAMRANLGESLATLANFDVPIEQATTPSLDALKAYTLGQASRAEGRELQAVPFFERAVALDPHFGSAWNALSIVYGNLGESDKARGYGARAFEESEQVSERERLAIAFQYHDRVTGNLDDAIASLELWKRLYPRDYRPPNSLAVLLNRAGDYERAVEEAREAQRRNPDHGFPYSNLAYALRGLNQFDEARAVAGSAVTRGIETLPTRRLLFQLALARGDEAEAAQHVAWARGRLREFDMVGAQAQVAAYEGRWADARDLYRRTADLARASKLDEVANAYTAKAAWAAALLGHTDEARALARPLLAGATPQVRLQLAAALAAASDPEGLAPLIEASVRARKDDTLLTNVTGPIARAAVHLAIGRPLEAQVALRPSERYELGSTAALAPLHLRAQAFLDAENGAEAAAEFKHLHDHRGSDPFSIFHALATLGLARAQALAGDEAASRASYARFLDAFSKADPDLPLVARARAELQRLQRAG